MTVTHLPQNVVGRSDDITQLKQGTYYISHGNYTAEQARRLTFCRRQIKVTASDFPGYYQIQIE